VRYLNATHTLTTYVSAKESSGFTSDADIVGFFALLVTVIVVVAMIFFFGIRKAQIKAGQEDALRQLVSRYEQLAENSLDAQQRVASDVSELRSRTTSIEQILRSVE
jgi:hypothetical protein